MSVLPIALELDAGAALRQALGLAVVSELRVSQAETLPITAVIYLGLDRFFGRAPVLSAEGSAD